jgi:hypothetical protein
MGRVQEIKETPPSTDKRAAGQYLQAAPDLDLADDILAEGKLTRLSPTFALGTKEVA